MQTVSRRIFLSTQLAIAAARATGIRRIHYDQFDVFTRHALAGNQLAVFLDPQGLLPGQMLAITREMGFSETTFVFPADRAGTDFRVRIFGLNLNQELAVAGHPTIGTVFALAAERRIKPGGRKLVLGLGIGPTPVELEWEKNRLQFVWMYQQRPEFGGKIDNVDSVAHALGIDSQEIRRTGLPVQQVSCGAPFLMVPVATRAAVDQATLDRNAIGSLLDAAGLIRRGVFVFSLERGNDDATAYSRMFGFGVVEDPATGNASGPLGCYLVHYKVVSPENARHLISRQGVKMGRPSEIHIAVDGEAGDIQSVRVGGAATMVASGSLILPT